MKEELIQNLQQRIRDLSCNSLRRVYPLQLQEWSGATNKEIKSFIAELISERLMDCKYDFQCSCGNNCTAYQKSIEINPYQCNECERVYEFDEVLNKGALLYELDKQAILNYEEERIDFKDIARKISNVVTMPIKQEEKSMEIFMGSSLEAKDFMDEIAVKLEELGITPLLWNAVGKNIFVAGTNTIDALIDITKRVQGAIFIFNADDKTWNDKSALDVLDTVRDNVLFEYGLFVGALEKENVCFVCKGKPKIASDLKGVTYIDGDLGYSQIKLKLRDWINAIK